jgi:hypothetical protein
MRPHPHGRCGVTYHESLRVLKDEGHRKITQAVNVNTRLEGTGPEVFVSECIEVPSPAGVRQRHGIQRDESKWLPEIFTRVAEFRKYGINLLTGEPYYTPGENIHARGARTI